MVRWVVPRRPRPVAHRTFYMRGAHRRARDIARSLATTRTPGITIVAGGLRFIDKRHRGVRIEMRVGNISQEQAEQRLQTEISRVDCGLFRKAHARTHFIDCAARYLAQCKDKRSVETIRVHVRLLLSHLDISKPVRSTTRRSSLSFSSAWLPKRAPPRSIAAWKSFARFSIVLRDRIATKTAAPGSMPFRR